MPAPLARPNASGTPWRMGPPGFHAAPSGAAQCSRRRLSMTWQTPQACDFRFGFEITMYVAAR